MNMSDNKKFYWIKLNKDFFKRHDIRIIEEMPNGKDYILFYLKLLLESCNHEGHLRFSETIPYNEQMLSVITNTNIDNVRSAMKVLAELKMLEILDDSTIYMSEVTKLVGSETEYAKKKREYRQNLLSKGQTKDNVQDDVRQEIEKEIEIELEKDIIKSDKPTRKRFTPPTLEEVQAYCLERNNTVDAERFMNHYTSNGWLVGKNKMKDWKAAVRTWEKSDYNSGRAKTQVKNEQQGSGNIFVDMLNERQQKGGFYDS
jgi:predicted phage replisome organizer